MAIDYTGNPNGLFRHIGKVIRVINDYEAIVDSTFPADRDAILGAFEAGGQSESVQGIFSTFSGFQSTVDGFRSSLKSTIDLRLTDEGLVRELELLTQSISSVVQALDDRMIDDGETINRSTVTLGSVIADSGNVGTGKLFTTKTLDGATAPSFDIVSDINYLGVDSELASPSETMIASVTSDVATGTASGSEVFTLQGDLRLNGAFNWPREGSGQGPTMATLNASTILQNGDFETFTSANIPDFWTIDLGTAGVHIFEEIVSLFRGSSAVKFTGDGVIPNIQISQAAGTLTANKRYALVVAYKSSSVPASGKIVIQFEGTGYTASSSEKIEINAGGMATTYTLERFEINMPATIPTDLKLVIRVESTLSSGVSIFFDSLAFGPVTYHGGVGMYAVAGTTPFERGDKFQFTVTNDQAGKFQDFWRRAYRRQLPSSGSPTISDALVV